VVNNPPEHPEHPDAIDPNSPVHKVELLLSTILRTGVFVSLAVIITGTIVRFVHHHDYLDSQPQTHALITGDSFPHTMKSVITGVRQGRSDAIITIGLLLLIATPVMRVAVSILAFAYQRDMTFILLTSFVLAMLILSFILGRAGG
jgi:uncharacterized membrane protein